MMGNQNCRVTVLQVVLHQHSLQYSNLYVGCDAMQCATTWIVFALGGLRLRDLFSRRSSTCCWSKKRCRAVLLCSLWSVVSRPFSFSDYTVMAPFIAVRGVTTLFVLWLLFVGQVHKYVHSGPWHHHWKLFLFYYFTLFGVSCRDNFLCLLWTRPWYTFFGSSFLVLKWTSRTWFRNFHYSITSSDCDARVAYIWLDSYPFQIKILHLPKKGRVLVCSWRKPWYGPMMARPHSRSVLTPKEEKHEISFQSLGNSDVQKKICFNERKKTTSWVIQRWDSLRLSQLFWANGRPQLQRSSRAGAISFVNKAQPNSQNHAMWNEFVPCSIIMDLYVSVGNTQDILLLNFYTMPHCMVVQHLYISE